MLIDKITRSIKYIGSMALFSAIPAILMWLVGGWERALAFFFLGFVGANAYGCYMSFKLRGAAQALVFFFVFALATCILATTVTASLVALGKLELR